MLNKFLVINPCLEDSRGQRCRNNGTKVKVGTVGTLSLNGVKSDWSVAAVPVVTLRWLWEL